MHMHTSMHVHVCVYDQEIKATEEGTQKVAKPIGGQLRILGNVAEELTSPQGQGPEIFRIRFKPNGNHLTDFDAIFGFPQIARSMRK